MKGPPEASHGLYESCSGVPSGLEFLSPEYVDNRAAAFRKVPPFGVHRITPPPPCDSRLRPRHTCALNFYPRFFVSVQTDPDSLMLIFRPTPTIRCRFTTTDPYQKNFRHALCIERSPLSQMPTGCPPPPLSQVDGWLLEFQSQSRPTVVFVQGTTDLPIHQHLPMLGTVPVKHLQVTSSGLGRRFEGASSI